MANPISNITRRGHKNGLQPIHPYFGKLDPALAETLIKNYSEVGDKILDPFCGSGTILYEGAKCRRNIVGWDSSPLAQLISTSKLIGIIQHEEVEISSIIEELSCFLEEDTLFNKPVPDKGEVPDMPRITSVQNWFNSNALHELKFLRWFINGKKARLSQSSLLLIRLAFSKIIIKASNQQGESTYRRVEKPDKKGRVVKLFLQSLKDTLWYANQLSIDLGFEKSKTKRVFNFVEDSENHIEYENLFEAFIEKRDARVPISQTNAEGAKLVVTSPPYLMSWDYGLYHKFRFYWLGFDLDEYEESEIGRHLRRKNDDIERYTNDMERVFFNLSRVLAQDGKITMVNAPSIVHGKKVDTDEIIVNSAMKNNWKLEDHIVSVNIPGPHHGLYGKSRSTGQKITGNPGKKEHVLVFSRI